MRTRAKSIRVNEGSCKMSGFTDETAEEEAEQSLEAVTSATEALEAGEHGGAVEVLRDAKNNISDHRESTIESFEDTIEAIENDNIEKAEGRLSMLSATLSMALAFGAYEA